MTPALVGISAIESALVDGGSPMATTVRSALRLVLFVVVSCGMLQAHGQVAVDPAVWGPYARLAGSTTQSDQYEVRWHWSQPGVELVEEYVARKSGKVALTNVITPGTAPGRLHLTSSFMHKEWEGTLQSDGSVLWIGKGLLKMSYRASVTADGTFERPSVFVHNGQISAIGPVTPDLRFVHQGGPVAPPAVVATAASAGPDSNNAVTHAVPPTAAAMPAVPAGAGPSKSQDAQVSQWDALNRRFNTALLNAKSSLHDGLWLAEEQGYAFSMTRGANGTMTRKTFGVAQDGRQGQISTSLIFDHARGTWQEVTGAKTREWRVVSQERGRYRVETLPEAGKPQALPYWAEISGNRFDLYAPEDHLKRAYRWVPRAKALASLKSFADRRVAELRSAQEKLAQDQAAKAKAAQVAASQRLTGEFWDMERARFGVDFNTMAEYEEANAANLAEMDEEAARQSEESDDDDAPAQPSAAWVALQNALQDATEHAAQSRAVLDETLAQAARQAADEREAQSQADESRANDEYARQAQAAHEATERQDEIARQFEAQQAQREAAQREEEQQASTSSPEPDARNGQASTDDDANRCVSSAEIRQNDTFQGNTSATVSNGCGQPIDMRICLMTERGWNCGVTYGVQSQASHSFSAFHATGQAFVDARMSSSQRPLAQP
jgi:hypothetical protein